jgi:predicted nicotinamide N-methyase
MKQVFKDKIINIDSNISDNKFLIKKINWKKNTLNNKFEVVFLSDLLEEKKNLEMLEKSKTKPATW